VFDGLNLKSVEMYDMDTQQWSPLPSMSTVRMGGTAVVVGHRIVVVGGNTDTTELFDAKTHQWFPLGSMTTKREDCVAGLIGNHMVAAGGYDGSKWLDTVESLGLDVIFGTSPSRNPAHLEQWSAQGCIGTMGGTSVVVAKGISWKDCRCDCECPIGICSQEEESGRDV